MFNAVIVALPCSSNFMWIFLGSLKMKIAQAKAIVRHTKFDCVIDWVWKEVDLVKVNESMARRIQGHVSSHASSLLPAYAILVVCALRSTCWTLHRNEASTKAIKAFARAYFISVQYSNTPSWKVESCSRILSLPERFSYEKSFSPR